jgi:hypothetical protein
LSLTEASDSAPPAAELHVAGEQRDPATEQGGDDLHTAHDVTATHDAPASDVERAPDAELAHAGGADDLSAAASGEPEATLADAAGRDPIVTAEGAAVDAEPAVVAEELERVDGEAQRDVEAEAPNDVRSEGGFGDAPLAPDVQDQAAGSAESPYDIPPLSLESIGATTPQAVGGDVSLDADDLAALGAAGWDAPSGLDEIDLLDELTPPFMRHEEASDDTALASALDVEALRALVDVRDGRDGGPLPLDGPNAAELEAAFRDRAVDLPLLDVDDLITPSVGNAPIESLDIEPFSVDSLLSQAPNFDETEPPSFLPEPLLSSETLDAPHETRQSSEPAPIADETDARRGDRWCDRRVARRRRARGADRRRVARRTHG